MSKIKTIRGIQLFAAVSIILALVAIVIAPVLDLDGGVSPRHLVAESERATAACADVISPLKSSAATYGSPPDPASDTCDQDGDPTHLHGVHSHVMLNTTSASLDIVPLSVIHSLSTFHLLESIIHPPTKPPSIST